MRTRHTTFMQALLLLFAVAFALPSHAQQLSEGWYQIKRVLSASDAERQMKDVKITGIADVTKKLASIVKDITHNEYLYVNEEFVAEQKFLGLVSTKKVYGAYYKPSPVKNGEVNTYFYVAPVEGETEAYTIRSYNGHYLHADGTFSVKPEVLYLGASIDMKAETTKMGFTYSLLAGLLNASVSTLKNIGGYSVGKTTKNYEFDPSKLAEGVDPGIKMSIGYKEMSWQQQTNEQTTTEGETEVVRKDYLDGKYADITNILKNVASDLLTQELDPSDAISLLRFVLRNFCSDAYKFEPINLNNIDASLEGIIGGILGSSTNYTQLVPYTVQIEGWDGTFVLNAASDGSDLIPFTHTNASVVITSDATHEQFNSAPIYNGGTIFAVKNINSQSEDYEHSFIDKGSHTCSNVVITPFEYKGGIFGVGANGVQDFSKCISAACVDEQNHIIHVFFTEPGKTWKINVEQGKFVTRNAPFALNISASEKEGLFNKKTYTSEVYYPTAIDDKEVNLIKIADNIIPAHTGVLIKNTSNESGSHEFKYTVASKEKQNLDAPADNLLHGTCFAHDLDADVNAYVLKTRDGEQKFYKLNQEDRMLAPWRAYLEYDGLTPESGFRIAGFDEELPEGINTVLSAESSDAAIYDLSGRRVSSSNGVNIIGGKKVIK